MLVRERLLGPERLTAARTDTRLRAALGESIESHLQNPLLAARVPVAAFLLEGSPRHAALG